MRLLLSGVALAMVVAAGCGRVDDVNKPVSDVDSVTGTLNSASIDYTKATHIFFVGESHDQHDQFVRAALGRAWRYRELYPDRQIVFYGNPEITDKSDRASFQDLGIKVVAAHENHKYTENDIITEMLKYGAISSYDYYGHSSAWATYMFSRWTSETRLAAVRTKFTSEASVTLNGCNAGLYLAPWLSKVWHIPVAAAATGTNFQQLHKNGQWYFNDPGLFPSGGWDTQNKVSYKIPNSCQSGACYRMKPENSPYRGIWGDSSAGGLGFYKFFCNYGGSAEDCQKRMAISLFSFPSVLPINSNSTQTEFQDAVFDFLCPISPTKNLRDQCRKGIQNAVASGSLVYSPFSGNTLECGLQGCDMRLQCSEDAQSRPIRGTCVLEAPLNRSPKTYANEYLHYLNGFLQLKKEQQNGPVPKSLLMELQSFRVTSNKLNCLEAAKSSASVVRTLPAHSEIRPLSENRVVYDSTQKPWLNIAAEEGGQSCYVEAEYRNIEPLFPATGSISSAILSEISTWKIQSQQLNCRRTGEPSSEVVETFVAGKSLTKNPRGAPLTDSRGLPWIGLTASGGELCFVSASWQFINPVR